MTRIVLLTWGSHGDVVPFVALAKALQAAGYGVALGAQPYHAEFIRRYGIEFLALGGETSAERYKQLMEALVLEANPRKQMRALLHEMLLPDLDGQYQDSLSAVRDADLVIAHWMQLAGMMAAETLHKPCVTVSLNPVGISVVADTVPAANAAARNLGKMLSDYIWGDEFHRFRERHDLPPIESVADYQYSKQMNLVAVSGALLPERVSFEAQHKVTGFWSLQDEQPWTPTPELEAFLAVPEKPVVITFGSMGGRAEEMTAIVAEAVHQAGCRAILQGGWAGLGAAGIDGPDGAGRNILRVDYVPHEYLFRHAACVVHHGGAGTTSAALRAGVPSVIVWYMLDQPYWGNLLARLDLGAKPLQRLGLTAAALAARINETLANPGYRTNCAQVAQQIIGEHGPENAVQEIKVFLKQMCRQTESFVDDAKPSA